MKSIFLKIALFFSLLLFVFCSKQESTSNSNKVITTTLEKEKFNKYWSQGKAEITSYTLTQARYGEIHEGTAVNIFVTENFLPKKQVKADYQNEKNVPILKLNSTKKFITGIYPYSIMTSTFSPVDLNKKAIKISFSSQEWCGNTFVQMNNKKLFEVDVHSYFETNSDRSMLLRKDKLENEVWNQIRINPKSLQTGRVYMIPSFEFLSLNHKEIKSYQAVASIEKNGSFIIYEINYPNLNRKLSIKINKEYPYIIEGWEEEIKINGAFLTTKAEKIKTIKSAYWGKNGVKNIEERNELGL